VLLPHATVLTPNLREADVLLDAPIGTLREQHEAARALGALGAATGVVTGEHAVTGIGSEAVDVVWDGRSVSELRGPRIDIACPREELRLPGDRRRRRVTAQPERGQSGRLTHRR
jgi:hydroxymethylpyrimidine/phosphomethylpyrimidine kinase